jgi:hypothetical protein
MRSLKELKLASYFCLPPQPMAPVDPGPYVVVQIGCSNCSTCRTVMHIYLHTHHHWCGGTSVIDDQESFDKIHDEVRNKMRKEILNV